MGESSDLWYRRARPESFPGCFRPPAWWVSRRVFPSMKRRMHPWRNSRWPRPTGQRVKTAERRMPANSDIFSKLDIVWYYCVGIGIFRHSLFTCVKIYRPSKGKIHSPMASCALCVWSIHGNYQITERKLQRVWEKGGKLNQLLPKVRNSL